MYFSRSFTVWYPMLYLPFWIIGRCNSLSDISASYVDISGLCQTKCIFELFFLLRAGVSFKFCTVLFKIRTTLNGSMNEESNHVSIDKSVPSSEILESNSMAQ